MNQPVLQLALVLDVVLGLAALGAEQRRLRDVDVAALDQLGQLAVEERQQQRADVGSVHVRVGHDDDAVVAQLLDVEVLGADAAPERRDHRPDLVAAQHLVEARPLDVEDLPLERQDRLELPVAPLLGRAAGRLALDDVQLAQRRVALLAVGQLARQAAVLEGALAAHQVAGLARRVARARRLHRLQDDPLGDGGVLLEERAELVVDDRLDDPLHLGVAELRLRLPLELRLRDLHADDRRQPLADVVAADALLQVLREVVLRRVEVDRPRQRRAEPREVGAALVRVDVVREAVDRLRVAVVPLQRDLGLDAVALAAHVDRLLGDARLVPVQVRDELADAPLVLEPVAAAVAALVVQRDGDAGVEERQLAQPLRQRVEAEVDRLEDLAVGQEGDLRPALLRLAGDLEVGLRLAAVVDLVVDDAVPPDFEVERLGQRVDHRHADAVQAARHLVAVVVELAARVQHRHHDLGRGPAALVHVDGDPAPVVDDRHRVVDVDGDVDRVAEAGQRLVDRVVDHLVDEVVQPGTPVEPMYIAGRWRTASSPSRTLILSAP